MSRQWENQFKEWAKPPGKAETDRCDNARSSIQNAMAASADLKERGVIAFAQGSYRNNTNVKKDSDVDVGILCTSTLLNSYPDGMSREDFGLGPSDYSYNQYKNEVEEALVKHFDRSAVTRGNKAFNIRENSYHVEADVAAFFEHRRYHKDRSYIQGVALLTDDDNTRIINWPEQHYEEGCGKNNATGRRFKSVVRILKSLSHEMVDAGVSNGDLPGFLIECLVFNVPNAYFEKDSYLDIVRDVLGYIFLNTKEEQLCKKWVEVSQLKWLFRASQPWTAEQAREFTHAALNFDGLGG